MMPTSGTATIGARGGSARISRMKTAVPIRAVTTAIAIFTISGADGNTITAIRMPTPADSVVPTVPGSTKRLRTSNCISSPDSARAAPARRTAAVRGIR